MTLLSCIALIALTYRLCARNLRNRASVKNGAPPREQRSKSGRFTGPISGIFGAVARVLEQDGCRHGSTSGIPGFRITTDKRIQGTYRESGFRQYSRD